MENSAYKKNLNVAVIGAGWAGLAAATELVSDNIPVTVFEAGQILGGRARRVVRSNYILDNGLHILSGAHCETMALIDKVSDDNENTRWLRIPISADIRPGFYLKESRLPYPLNLICSILGAVGLDIRDKFMALKFILRLHSLEKKCPRTENVAELLRRANQPERVRAFLWEPICLATLNTKASDASARHFLTILKEMMCEGYGKSDLILPRKDLTTLFPERVKAFIESRCGQIFNQTRITKIRTSREGLELEINKTRHCHFSHVIIAVAPYQLAQLVNEIPSLDYLVDKANRLNYQPIYSIYLKYPDHVSLPKPMMGFSGSLSQWAFDRGRLLNQNGIIGVVLSGKGEHEKLAHGDLANQIHSELAQEFGFPNYEWYQVIAEKKATFSCSPNRPIIEQKTMLKNVFLAGDYTVKHLPGTLESAVVSGANCLKLVRDNA